MRRQVAVCAAFLLLSIMPLLAGQAAKQPRPKTQKELEALQKVQAAAQAGNVDEELADINNVLENFVDTEFKPQLLVMAVQASERKNDYALIVTWSERLLQSDPNDIDARVALAEATARHTRENDLDKADSIKKIQDNANKALELLKTANTPPVGVPDAQWPDVKKDLTGRAYLALGQADTLDKKFPDALTQYKAAVAADPTPAMKAYLSKSYVENKQYDDAITTADQVIADASAPAVVKQFAQSQKDAATKLKGGAK
jgi:tetratricopeptide (TPR) repeat protein